MLWKVILETYFISLDLNVLISIEYGTHDEFNEEAKNIILKGLSYHDLAKVRHYWFGKDILDKLHSMYGGEEFQY